ncbi:MAG TPA: biotin--[acetyl-CoA-carboxylase] ligase [Bacteroidales bacterium]|nr:biotin--[acetyl-CoA-carboxylase] ligase [Bacteroidales bacterium]
MAPEKYDIIYLPETDSTNLQASALLSERHDKTAYVVTTGFQDAGKGQSGNVWISEKDKNLLCSIVIYPDFLGITNHFYLSKITALVLHDLLRRYIPKPEIKWPNDILVNERKIAGILIENTLQNSEVLSSVIGIGLNVNQADFPEFYPGATSILNETGTIHDTDVILNHLLEQFDYWYGLLKESQWQVIDSAYFKVMYRFNRFAPYSVSGYQFKARIVGVEPDGHILLEKQDKELLKFGFKDVAFLKGDAATND